jgi:hypothetical protein
VIALRRWLSRKFYLWSWRIYEDWHEVEVTSAGERITVLLLRRLHWFMACALGVHLLMRVGPPPKLVTADVVARGSG